MDPPTKDPTLLGITVRRSLVLGRMFLLAGLIYAVVFSLVLGLTAGPGFDEAFPLLLPVFAVIASMGALMVFSSDRIKGVLEYLLAYGFSSRRLFVNVLLAGFVLAVILVGVSTAVGLGVRFGSGQGVSAVFVELLLAYGLPMTFASVGFAVTVGMYWTSLSSPRSGINSPVGLAPIVGIAPPLITLVLVGFLAATTSLPFELVAGPAVVVVALVVLALLAQVDRLLPLERLLSPT